MLIKEIPIEERPRERLIKYGSNNLSNEELLAIILKTGTKGVSCKELSLQVLKKITNLSNLKNIDIHTFDNIKGLGTVKKIELMAILELGKRIYLENNALKKEKYNNPEYIYLSCKHLFVGVKQECFYCLYLDTKKNLIERKLLFMGTLNKSIVHPREIFKEAYMLSASSIICMHNHPSGDCFPSPEDIYLTKSLMEIGKLQQIPVVDHIIFGSDKYYSFYDNESFMRGILWKNILNIY